MSRIGIAISGGPNASEIVELVKLAETLGYDSAWVAEGHGGDQFAILAACAVQTRPPNRAANALHAQLDEDWNYWMTQYPETATAFGYPGQNMRWADYSQNAIDARAGLLDVSECWRGRRSQA